MGPSLKVQRIQRISLLWLMALRCNLETICVKGGSSFRVLLAADRKKMLRTIKADIGS
jgi:hypothetical protein